MVLTDNSATVGRILMISSADLHEILILIKWWKNQPSSLQMPSRKIRIIRIVDFGQFWPIFAQRCLGFSEHTFYFWAHQHETFGYQSALLGEHLSQKFTPDHIYNNFWPKTSFLESIFWGGGMFVKRPIKHLGKIFRTQKTDCQNHVPSQSNMSLKFEFVCSQISPL